LRKWDVSNVCEDSCTNYMFHHDDCSVCDLLPPKLEHSCRYGYGPCGDGQATKTPLVLI